MARAFNPGLILRHFLLLASILLFHAVGALAAENDAGEAIYLRGQLPSGQPLRAVREGGVPLEGREVACVQCHRRSGFGGRESRISIPPITARYLFHPRAAQREDLDLPFVEGIRADRDPYDDETLARAIREGINVEGKPLNYVMPRYALDDAGMAALIAYLKGLDKTHVPGVGNAVLHFATIITPEADPVARQGMLDVLNRFFADKNNFPISTSPALRSTRRMMYMVNRQWQLHVWELHGEPDSWPAQLQQHLAKEPVLAVISGLGGAHWAPVHDFCERSHLPCLYPNVEAPPAQADQDYYSLYFSKGVILEAELIAKHLRAAVGANKQGGSIIQVLRAGDVGGPAATSLGALLAAQGIAVHNVELKAQAPEHELAAVLRKTNREDVVVLWLRGQDLAALANSQVPAARVYMSGTMAGLERVNLSAAWRTHVLLAYPVGLPDERRVGVDFAYGWLRIKHIPVVADRIQADTYLACGLLAETLKHMVDNFVPDYLIERDEDMLDKRLITGHYPRLSLAPGQRFASKGGYIVRFAKPPGKGVVPDGGWTVP
jgi:hypothetical protein